MMQPAKNIVILCSRLDLPGGIEKAIVSLTNLLSRKGQEITILVMDEPGEVYFLLDKSVKIRTEPLFFGIGRDGNLLSRKSALVSDILKLKKILRSIAPDLVIATEYPFVVAAILAGAKKNALVVSWEHHHFHELKKSFVWDKLCRLSYPRLDAIICLNADEQKLFSPLNDTVLVIPNFVEQEAYRGNGRSRRLLTVARINQVKGIDYLMQIASLVLPAFPAWEWKLIGNGEMKSELENFAIANKLQSQLIIQDPAGPDISREYEEASLYIMCSRNECFPMTLLEGMRAGLPCVAFDCETGPRHIIQQGQNGLLVPMGNIESMVNAITSLLKDEGKRNSMAAAAMQSVEKFSPDYAWLLWEQLLEVAGGKAKS